MKQDKTNNLDLFKPMYWCLLLFSAVSSLFAQNKILTFESYYNQVLENHPIAKQANLLDEMAKMEVRTARGGFDPKLDLDWNRKIFKDTVYYDYKDFGLKVPTWFGANLMAGFQQNAGKNINPAEFTPSEGLWYLGLDFNIVQSVVIDERRAVLKMALAMKQINDAEKIKIINKILLNAAKDYWEWYFYYNRYLIRKKSYQLAEARYKGITQRVIGGDLAPMDSIEGKVTLQERYVDLQDALNDFQNAALSVSNYLWTTDQEPLEISENTLPEDKKDYNLTSDTTLAPLLEHAENSHPEILKLKFKITQLEIDKKLKFMQMLPAIQITGKYISTPNRTFANDLTSDYFLNNNRFYIGVLQPLFLRKERGKYQMSKIKIEQASFEQMMLKREITTNVKSAQNDVVTYYQLISNQKNMIESTTALLNAEKYKFDVGESTVFLVNSRETKMLDSEVKLFDLMAKLEKSKAILLWSAGKSK